MSEFFELLFSPSGCVGRAVWWISSILITLADIFLAIVALVVLGAAITALDPTAAHHSLLLHKLTAAEITRDVAAANSVRGELYVIGGLALLVFWTSLVIEIKRWHDRGMSGFFVLLRFVPLGLQFYQGWYPLGVHQERHLLSAQEIFAYYIVSGAIWLFQIVQLGFLPGVDIDVPRASARAGRLPARGYSPGYPAQPAQPPPSRGGGFVFGFFCALFLICAVGAAYYWGQGSLPDLSSKQPDSTNSLVHSAVPASQPPTSAPAPATVTPPTAPPGNLNDTILSREHVDNDNLVTTYAKDWVIADGEKLSGITSVVAAPQYQVTILYAEGGKNVPAASLPPGFLSDWNITQDKLDAANKPPDQPSQP